MEKSLDGLISFFSSFHAIRAETVLKRAGYVVELIPGPKDLSPNCGTALRIEYARREDAQRLLAAKKVQIENVHRYKPRTDIWETQVAQPDKQSAPPERRRGKWLAAILPNL